MKIGIFRNVYYLLVENEIYYLEKNGTINYYYTYEENCCSVFDEEEMKIIFPHFGFCEFCREYKILYSIYDKQICESCIRENFKRDCYICGYRNIFLKRKYNRGFYCPECYSKLFICSRCGEAKVKAYENGVQIRKKIYCSDCWKKIYPVHKYSYTPILNFNKVNSYDKDFIGIELEIEFDEKDWDYYYKEEYKLLSKIAKKALLIKRYFRRNNFNLFYLKRDSSISGAELVSHPFTYNWFKRNKNKIKKLFTFLKKIGAVSYKYGRAGLHIHLSKDIFPLKTDLFKLFLFYNINYDNVVKIAQRAQNGYCRFSKYDLKDFVNFWNVRVVNRDSFLYDHHYAINFSKKNTIELRFFRGTLNFKVFCGIIDFIFAVKDFIKFYSIFTISGKNSWNIFIDFCKKNGYKDFIELWNKLNKARKPITDKSK